MSLEGRAARIFATGLVLTSPYIFSACEANSSSQPITNNPEVTHTPSIKIEPSTREKGIKKDVGEWSKEDIERMANIMIADSRFTTIVRAGEILLESQYSANRAPSRSSVFTKSKINIETVPSLDPDYPDRRIPMDAKIRQNQPLVVTSLKSKDGGPDFNLSGGSSLGLERIRISQEIMKGQPDILHQLFLTKELYNMEAFDIVTQLVSKDLALRYQIPENELVQNALRASAIHWDDEGAPVYKIADLLAHFLILPDYNLAKDLGMITTTQEPNNFWLLDTATEMLIEQGTLIKGPDGVYRWKDNPKEVNEAMYQLAWAGIKAGILE